MKILALSDIVDPLIYSLNLAERHRDVSLIVGCGDLPANYLEYVVSVLDVPLVYVPGNHDPDDYQVPGGESIDGRVLKVGDLLVAGLGGSRRYKLKGAHQYTEEQMQGRARVLWWRLLWHSFLRRPLDVFVTHAPPFGIHDSNDPAHTGFRTFRHFIDRARPQLMLHGHSHIQRNLEISDTTYEGCEIINVYPFRVIEYHRPNVHP